MKDRIELLERVERRRVVRGKYFVESARLACLNKGSMSRGIEIRRWWILRGLMEDFFFFFFCQALVEFFEILRPSCSTLCAVLSRGFDF